MKAPITSVSNEKEGCHPRTRHSPDVPPHEEHGHTKETENAIEHQPECRAYADDRPLLSPQWVVEIFVHFSIAVIVFLRELLGLGVGRTP